MTDPFDNALKRQREALNGRFRHAMRSNRNLEPDAFLQYLDTRMRPIVTAVAEMDDIPTTTVDGLTSTLYDISLTLVGRDYAGPTGRHSTIDRMWVELFPRVADLLVDEPYDVCASLTNAAYNLSVAPTADDRGWLDAMLDCVDAMQSVDDLRAVGMVLGWRCGLAHYRRSALIRWAELPEPLQRETLSVPDHHSLTSVTEALADPWRDPARPGDGAPTLEVVATVGAFRGFGGDFHRPPTVRAVDGRLYVEDEVCLALHADHFGATLQRVGSAPEGEATPSPFRLDASGVVTCGDLTARFDGLARAHSWAANETTLAVTTPRAHRVFLVAKVSR